MKKTLTLILLCGTAIQTSYAETLPALIDPNNPAKAARDIPSPVQPKRPSVTIKAPAAPSKYTLNTPITVSKLQFIGGTVYPLKSLVSPFRPIIGKTVPLKDIIQLANSITARYKADGYPLSYAWIPDDNFHDGMLKIVLVEGYIARTNINSNNPKSAQRIQRLAEKLMQQKPLRQETFDRYSILMTRTPGTKVDASAQLPENIYGAAVMQVNAQQPHIWDLSSTLDTRKGQDLAIITGSLSNLSSYGDQLGIATLLPLDRSTRKTYFGMNYQQFLNDEGLALQLKGSFYRENPQDYTTLAYFPEGITIDAKEKTTQYIGGASLSYPLILTRQRQLNVTGGFDYTDRKDDYRLRARGYGNTLDLPGVVQRNRYPAVEVGMNGYQQFSPNLDGNMRLGVRQGIDAMGANADPSAGTDLNFTLWKSSVDAGWMFLPNWRLSTAWEGDYSNRDLPEAERVQFGAQHFGRGYQDGEASGDYGYGGQLELRYFYQRPQSTWLATVQPYVLTDTAKTWFNQPGYRHQRLASVAAGVMFGDNHHYTLAVEAAKPVGDTPIDSDNRDWRYSLTVTWNFNNLR